MFINKDSIIINGVSIGQYILKAKFGYNKMWSEDTGRNLAGTMSGTLLGVFPKITLEFRKLTKEELEIVAPILDSANQTVTYYDPNKMRNVTMTTYTGDYEIENSYILKNGRKNSSFSCSFISTRRRG